jgi:hypothetical protein
MGADNDTKVLRSRNGVKITLRDTDGQESFTVETPGGRTIVLKDQDTSVAIDDGTGNTIKLEPAGLAITATAKVKIEAPMVEITASMVDVKSGMVKCSGVVQCTTLIATTVVGSTYTPGAGNIW